MSCLIAKVEGKGNGIKTVIVNMADIAKALNWPPTYSIKYFGCELGAQTQFDVKNDHYIVKGSHGANKLQDMLDGFIKKFVLCPECESPETDLHVNPKKQTIGNSCKTCGYQACLTHIINSVHSFSKTHLRTVTLVQERKKRKRKIERTRTRIRKMALYPLVRHHHLHHQNKLVLHMLWKKRKMMIGGRIQLRKLKGTEWMKSVTMQKV